MAMFRTCQFCQSKVIPKRDGRCPNCKNAVDVFAPSVEQTQTNRKPIKPNASCICCKAASTIPGSLYCARCADKLNRKSIVGSFFYGFASLLFFLFVLLVLFAAAGNSHQHHQFFRLLKFLH